MKLLQNTARSIALATVLISTVAIAREIKPPLSAATSDDWTMEVVADGLDYPWDIEVAGERLVVTEAGGNVVFAENGRLSRFPLQTSDPILRDGGGGLLGMALSKDFDTSGTAFFYHSYASEDGLANKVIQARFDGTAWRETGVLMDKIPGHRLYNGGRIAIGPDGNLYVTTGWTENRARPQDITNLAGKVLRMTLDGGVPADNPFPGSYVYSYGHRNPQGIAWDQRGRLMVAEHGQSAYDEINLVKSGGNYGWPLVSGNDERQGMEKPLLHSASETWGPSGIAFAGDELLVTALVSRELYAFDETAGQLSRSSAPVTA